MSDIKENAFLSPANVVFVGIYGCMYVYVSMCRLYISVWYMYIKFIFVLNNQCDMKSK